jgi:carbamoyl-phosphate synthase large subunit
MNNILFCSVGRRVRLIQDIKSDLNDTGKIIATDYSSTAPALYVADSKYIVPKITDEQYLDILLEICKKENIKAVTTLIDPEIEVLASNRDCFIKQGILPLCPSLHTALLCFDKYTFFKYLNSRNIPTIKTYDTLDDFKIGLNNGEINFPVFIKPRTGSGSVGARKISDMTDMEHFISKMEYDYIIQEFMDAEDIDADVYVDCISKEVISIFTKKKLETKIGGANKTISFKNDKLFIFIQQIIREFDFYGPLDMDFFYKDGTFYLSEINPRFGGAYIHAHAAGIQFTKFILNNIQGKVNVPCIANYDLDIVMMMYDDIIIKHKDEI